MRGMIQLFSTFGKLLDDDADYMPTLLEDPAAAAQCRELFSEVKALWSQTYLHLVDIERLLGAGETPADEIVWKPDEE